MDSFYTQKELEQIGFGKLGREVKLSKKASIYSPERISIGDNVRIDDFCILSGKITIGNYVHIAAYVAMFGGNAGIVLENYTGISSRSVVYAESDDYSGCAFTNPMLPIEYRKLICGTVTLKKHAILGTGVSVMPGVTIAEGVSVGSMSLVNKDLDPWGIYVGIPCKRIKDRSQKLLALEDELLQKGVIH